MAGYGYDKTAKIMMNDFVKLIAMSTNVKSRIHHNAKPGSGHDLFYQIDSRTFRLYEARKDPSPIYQENYVENPVSDDETEVEEPKKFGHAEALQYYNPTCHLSENSIISGSGI
jgi:hypothetical protein